MEEQGLGKRPRGPDGRFQPADAARDAENAMEIMKRAMSALDPDKRESSLGMLDAFMGTVASTVATEEENEAADKVRPSRKKNCKLLC